MYDVVIAGGSIAGLLTAREIASSGFSVLVVEEGFEVGTPEHCGGLVSQKALSELGVELSAKSFDSKIHDTSVSRHPSAIHDPLHSYISYFVSGFYSFQILNYKMY